MLREMMEEKGEIPTLYLLMGDLNPELVSRRLYLYREKLRVSRIFFLFEQKKQGLLIFFFSARATKKRCFHLFHLSCSKSEYLYERGISERLIRSAV
jgi:hypothetical protein